MKKLIVVISILLLLIFIILFPIIQIFIAYLLPECDSYTGGWPSLGKVYRTTRCNCIGLKIGYDNTGGDGDMRYGCLGIVKEKNCTKFTVTESYFNATPPVEEAC